MEKKNDYGCTLLRLERIRQKKGQKEVCFGICVPSYLSKIEHCQVTPDREILRQLFSRLGIIYYAEADFVQNCSLLIEQYYEQLFYGLDTTAYQKLLEDDQKLTYSPLALDWLLVKAANEQPEALRLLSECSDHLDDRQTAYYYIAKPLLPGSAVPVIPFYQKAYHILNNSYCLLALMNAYYLAGQYEKIQEHMDKCISLALEEGNTCNLAGCYELMGSVYACLNAEELMIPYYRRAIHLLQNTNWKDQLNGIYYNIGATYISSKKYDLALQYLKLVEEKDSFLLNQKLALIYIRSGREAEASSYIDQMKLCLMDKEEKSEDITVEKMMLEEVQYECRKGFLADPEYIELLERLIDLLRKNLHRGFVMFYSDYLMEAYCMQRKYKKALELSLEISQK